MVPAENFRQRLWDLIHSHECGPGQARSELEGRLSPLVGMALRKGVGAPGLVHWVHAAFARLSDGASLGPPEHYTPQITRLLCAELMRGAGGNI
jgi:hypothetical protein